MTGITESLEELEIVKKGTVKPIGEWTNMEVEIALKENELRFGSGSCLEQLEKAKRGTDYDFAVNSIHFKFILKAKYILHQNQISTSEKINQLMIAITLCDNEYHKIAKKLG